MTPTPRYYVVDRLEGDLAILIADTGERAEVRNGQLPFRVSEGMVLAVPIAKGTPDWKRATRDEAEERRRQDEGKARLARLRKRDPGGDVKR